MALVSGVFSLPLIDSATGPRDFLAGQENALVRTLLRIVIDQDRDHFPLVICGPTGAGKTFLAEGLAEAWRRAQPDRSILRLTGADFARQYADACDTDSITDFRERTLRTGLILIDAVPPLVEKDRAAREFCVHLDAWQRTSKLVIVTSLVAPLDLAHAGLASRLGAGLVAPIALPSLDTRRHMLNQFARERSLLLSDDLIDHLAERLTGSVTTAPSPRDLHAALTQLQSTATLTGVSIDARLIDSVLRPAAAAVDGKRIVSAVAKRFGVPVDELRSSSRRQSLVRARGVVVVLARRLTHESLQSLGTMLGNRDHSTIHHALETTERSLDDDAELRDLLEQLETELTTTQPVKRHSRSRLPSGT